ncbi:ABC transporter ATP-binding protein [Devosia lacusdianchii]|uniref:ABC transporter ATP-binding protein n=1 Tax=Devosia lacusdianchii TaxID=2917991 RepID=UPI001F06CB35|nr:sn-glycerol-3-phosphate ABC transporter ATP-binding protein UgpC [Devosia sp. JXJ CY 41]
MAHLQLVGIRKSFDKHEVIRDTHLEVEDGAFCVFVGPSGCGKSTLLRIIAGLETASSGEVRIGGKPVNDVDPSDRGIAMVFQSYALYPHMSVRENMGFGLRMGGTPKAEIAARVAQAADILQITPLLDRRPAQLSGGQRQRVAIGRAIVRDPKVFLFDEPLSNLDAELRVQMRVEISRLHKSLGTTMIYVTHDQTEAMTMADTIVVMRAGVIEQAGPPLQLYADPDNAFVAGFLGSPRMNFFKGTVSERDGKPAFLLADGQTLPVPHLSAPPSPGQDVQIGIRPEHMDSVSPDARLTLTVDVVEHLGTTNFVYARGPAGENVVVEKRGLSQTAAQVECAIEAAHIRVFSNDGSRLR